MAIRNRLAEGDLEAFKKFLVENGWKIEDTKGKYEVLRDRHSDFKKPFLVYYKHSGVHLTYGDMFDRVVTKFLNSK